MPMSLAVSYSPCETVSSRLQHWHSGSQLSLLAMHCCAAPCLFALERALAIPACRHLSRLAERAFLYRAVG